MTDRTISGSRVIGSPPMQPGKPMAVGGKITQHTPVVDKARYAEPRDADALRRAAGRKR